MGPALQTQKRKPTIAVSKRTTRYRLRSKRGFDIILSSIAIVCLLPLMVLISILIKIDSRGPILFSQPRVGHLGKLFKMYKFRSMAQDAEKKLPELMKYNEASGPLFKIKKDPRITRVGKLLRRSSLDELPQFFNVFIGNMSLVGPRPALANEVAQYEEWHKRRLEVMQGLTGPWQVNGRSDTSFDEMVKLDLEYIDNWSLILDIKILLKTITSVLRGHGAY